MRSFSFLGGLSLALVLSIGFSGCGGGGGSSSSTTNGTLTGTFIDAPVKGLSYSTATQSGTTDINGSYKYKSGETVTFKIGNLILGSVSAKKIITPLTLGGDTNLNSIGTKAKNIARILQSLDDNPTNTSTIVIPTSLQDLNVTNSDLLTDDNLQTILTRAQEKTSKSYILKSSTEAENEMKTFLQTYLYNGTYSATSTYSNSSILAPSQCGGTLQWTINIANGSTVTGSSTTDGTRTINGVSLNDSTLSGIANDGTTWNAIIDEDGLLSGTYNWQNGNCVGEIHGNKLSSTSTSTSNQDLPNTTENMPLAYKTLINNGFQPLANGRYTGPNLPNYVLYLDKDTKINFDTKFNNGTDSYFNYRPSLYDENLTLIEQIADKTYTLKAGVYAVKFDFTESDPAKYSYTDIVFLPDSDLPNIVYKTLINNGFQPLANGRYTGPNLPNYVLYLDKDTKINFDTKFNNGTDSYFNYRPSLYDENLTLIEQIADKTYTLKAGVYAVKFDFTESDPAKYSYTDIVFLP